MASVNFEQIFDRALPIANNVMLTVTQAPEREQDLLEMLERAMMRVCASELSLPKSSTVRTLSVHGFKVLAYSCRGQRRHRRIAVFLRNADWKLRNILLSIMNARIPARPCQCPKPVCLPTLNERLRRRRVSQRVQASLWHKKATRQPVSVS